MGHAFSIRCFQLRSALYKSTHVRMGEGKEETEKCVHDVCVLLKGDGCRSINARYESCSRAAALNGLHHVEKRTLSLWVRT